MSEIFLSSWGISSIIVATILFVMWYVFCVREISAVNLEIKNFLAWLETEREFQDIDAELKNYNRLLPVWKIFEKSLTKTNDAAYSTTDATDFFSTQNLTHGMNMTFWQAYGGIFTGLGILGTFAGLTYGLSGVDMTSGDIETLKNGIAKLLSGVESAFVTSLVGIFCAIIYSVVHHLLMKKFQGNVKLLTEKLDEIFPRRSAEDWLAKSCKITDDQTNSIKEIGEAVTQAIYEGLDEKLGEAIEKLDPLVEKICEAIENLGAGGTDTVGEIFSDRVGAQMDRFSVALDKFTNSIDEKLKNASEISKIMNEQLLSTLEELSAALKRDAKESAKERDDEYKKFSAVLESLIGTLNEVAEKIKTQQTNAAKDFETLLKNALDNFNSVMAQMLENLKKERDADDDKRKADAKQNQATNEQFLATLAGLSKTLQEIAENSKKQHETSAGKFESLVKSLLDDLKNFTEQQQKILGNVANDNAKQISEAVKAFNEIVARHNSATQKTFAQIQNLLNQNENFLQNMGTATTSLKQAAEPVRQSTLQLTRNLEETSAQMKNLSASNQTTRQNLFDLTTHLSTFVNNFKGIADELERSTKIIYDSLDNYNVKTNAGLKEKLEAFDNSMNQAFGYLNELIEELSGVIEDSKQSRRR